jgi:hypothetical protein
MRHIEEAAIPTVGALLNVIPDFGRGLIIDATAWPEHASIWPVANNPGQNHNLQHALPIIAFGTVECPRQN